jgi:fructose-1,6-bisphosphatase
MKNAYTQTLLGYGLQEWENGDIVLEYNSKPIAFGKISLDEPEKFIMYSEGSIYYQGTKEFNSFENMVRFFKNAKDSYDSKNSNNEFLYWN